MKKMLSMMTILGTCLLVGCGEAQADEVKNVSVEETIITETFLEETIITEEILYEEVLEEELTIDLLEGYDMYSEEYIDELYYNSIDKVVSLQEWRKLEKEGYNDNEIEYILMKQYEIW